MKYIYLFAILSCFSCNTYVEKNNEVSDIEEGKKMATQFYQLVKKEDYASIYSTYGKKDINELKSVFFKRDSIFGKITNADIKDIQTRYVNSNEREYTEYYIETNIVYEKGKTKEILGYETVRDSTKKLMRYSVESFEYQ